MATRKRQTKEALPTGSLPQHQNVTVVHSREEFEREAQRLRDSGYTEVPGYLGGGHGDSIKADYADYISSRLNCEANAGANGKAMLPLIHVSSGNAVPVTAENDHKGNLMTWGLSNKVPNVISLLCSLLPYTAAALKFNIDLCTGMGPRPMYAYTQYVGGNITHKTVPYEDADKRILGMIRDLQLQLVKLETEHPERAAWLARHAWRDEQIEQLYRQAWEHSDEGRQQLFGIPARYGTGIDWNEFHTSTPWKGTD